MAAPEGEIWVSVNHFMSLKQFEAEEHGLLSFFRREVGVAASDDANLPAVRWAISKRQTITGMQGLKSAPS
jgi:hypothetical protein